MIDRNEGLKAHDLRRSRLLEDCRGSASQDRDWPAQTRSFCQLVLMLLFKHGALAIAQHAGCEEGGVVTQSSRPAEADVGFVVRHTTLSHGLDLVPTAFHQPGSASC